jgi:hypothetical protein
LRHRLVAQRHPRSEEDLVWSTRSGVQSLFLQGPRRYSSFLTLVWSDFFFLFVNLFALIVCFVLSFTHVVVAFESWVLFSLRVAFGQVISCAVSPVWRLEEAMHAKEAYKTKIFTVHLPEGAKKRY